MEWLKNNAETVGALVGAAVSAWTLATRFHKSVINHLATHFATKQDLETGLARIETKLDSALYMLFRRADEAPHAVNVRHKPEDAS